ncbi:MAG: hypothetical protein K0S01_2357 [Herbinix sp.]|jgi:hypothetical protein|nr:hypothetical protein [Herbinix sp.]
MDNDKNGNKQGLETERRIDHLENLVEKKTRTERHLEQHTDISSSPKNIEHAKQIQKERQWEIDHLKDKIANGDNSSNDYKENTEKRFLYTEGYLNHNADHMDKQTFNNAMEKQEHRKDQLNSLK